MKNNLININNNINNVNITNNHNESINMNINSLSQNIKCTCSKTGCRKRYCICYSKGIPCQECDCQNCENRPNKSKQNLEKSNNTNSNISIQNYNNHTNQKTCCNCTKSNCTKKYCECYKKGICCNSFCRCILCNNYDDNNKNISKDKNDNNDKILKNNNNNNKINNINLSNSQNFSIYHFHEQLISKINDFKNPINFQYESFEVYLKKEKLKIDKRGVGLSINSLDEKEEKKELNQTPKFSKKKRTRNEEDNPNMRTCPSTNSLNKEMNGLCNVNKNIKKKKFQL